MSLPRIAEPILDAEERFEGFENLMPFRVQNILLVSSLYDSFILREDGRLNELLIDESLELNLRQIPGITHVSSCAEALDLARGQSAIQSDRHQPRRSATRTPPHLAREVRRAGLDIPVVVLGYDYREIKNFVARNPVTDIDRVFLWQGTARILIAIVKYVEDKRNVLHDTRAMGVPVLLVVEDNIRYYSSFLPVIYTELIKQSRRVIQEGINVAHKLVRMQARPKILLASNFEDAAQLVQKYRDYIFGIGLRCRVSLGWQAQSGSWIRAGAHGEEPDARCAGRAADQPHRISSARACRRLFVPAQAFAHAAERSAAHSDRLSSDSAILFSACPISAKWDAPKT